MNFYQKIKNELQSLNPQETDKIVLHKAINKVYSYRCQGTEKQGNKTTFAQSAFIIDDLHTD